MRYTLLITALVVILLPVVGGVPVFDGLREIVEVADAPGFLLEWDSAENNSGPVVYNIYSAKLIGGQNYSYPVWTTNETSFSAPQKSLEVLTWYFIVVRAEDDDGEENNTLEMSVHTAPYGPIPPWYYDQILPILIGASVIVFIGLVIVLIRMMPQEGSPPNPP